MKAQFYVIEKGIPVPPPVLGRPRGPILTAMMSLRPGDSFLVPKDTKLERVRSAAKRIGFKLVTRKMADGSRRIWRASK